MGVAQQESACLGSRRPEGQHLPPIFLIRGRLMVGHDALNVGMVVRTHPSESIIHNLTAGANNLHLVLPARLVLVVAQMVPELQAELVPFFALTASCIQLGRSH